MILRAAAALLAAALALSAAGCEWGTEEDAGPDTVTTVEQETVTAVPVPGSPPVVIDADREQTDAVRPEGVDAHEDARDETPPGVMHEDLEDVLEPVPGVGPPQPLGGAESLSCPWRPVRNFSSRGGARVSMVVLHYTVSAPGTLGVIRGLFDRPSFAASSHIGLEADGECEQWVAYGAKAWTQGAFNPVSESVEIIARGTESRSWWLRQPIIRNGLLASWIVDRLRANGLPPRRVDPRDCTPQAGWTDHNALECANTHFDVQPNFPYDEVARQVRERFQIASRITVWQLRAGGQLLRQSKVPGGYRKLLAWMGGKGAVRVGASEKRHGKLQIRKVTIEAP